MPTFVREQTMNLGSAIPRRLMAYISSLKHQKYNWIRHKLLLNSSNLLNMPFNATSQGWISTTLSAQRTSDRAMSAFAPEKMVDRRPPSNSQAMPSSMGDSPAANAPSTGGGEAAALPKGNVAAAPAGRCLLLALRFESIKKKRDQPPYMGELPYTYG